MENIKLIGHSGCHLEIKIDNNSIIVVKSSKDLAYNKRLEVQCEKQRHFKHKNFQTPTVFNSGIIDNGIFSFSMEYINGMTVSQYLKKIEIAKIDSLVKNFFHLIPDNYSYDKSAKEKFSNKINELENNINNSNLNHIFLKLKGYSWDYCISSYCHGDLTLENIVWDGKNLYFIDFLDSFYDSWMVDFAKILQDIECKWSYRNETEIDENLDMRLLIFKHIFIEKIVSLKDGQKILNDIYCILLVNLLRIIPYTPEEKTINYLVKEINKIYNKINF